MSFTTKLHLWVGLTKLDESQYWNYFDDGNGDCQFCNDVNLDWLDQDFMGYSFKDSEVNIQILIEETPEPQHHKQMIDDCLKKGIHKANAMFYYWGDDPINVNKNNKYNTLTYIGDYVWD